MTRLLPPLCYVGSIEYRIDVINHMKFNFILVRGIYKLSPWTFFGLGP
jgi:hypothetical protein